MSTDTLVERSKAFAHKVHEAINHKRKYTEEPYTVHLQAVADLVEEVSGTPEMIAAAWLHDTVEDASVSISVIEAEFGSKVAAFVSDLTDVSTANDGNRAKRKALDRAHLADASPSAKTIKLADLIDNARSIGQHDPRFARIFMREKQLLLEFLNEGDPVLFTRASKMVERYFNE